MAKRKEETVSFVLRFTQKIFQDEDDSHGVQWRGRIRHVQGNDEQGFSDFDQAVRFMQSKMNKLTAEAIKDKSPEEQEGILSKSLQLWKQMATVAPKVMLETLKDPKGSVEQFSEQVTEQVSQVSGMLNARLNDAVEQAKHDAEAWKPATKADVRSLQQQLMELTGILKELTTKS